MQTRLYHPGRKKTILGYDDNNKSEESSLTVAVRHRHLDSGKELNVCNTRHYEEQIWWRLQLRRIIEIIQLYKKKMLDTFFGIIEQKSRNNPVQNNLLLFKTHTFLIWQDPFVRAKSFKQFLMRSSSRGSTPAQDSFSRSLLHSFISSKFCVLNLWTVFFSSFIKKTKPAQITMLKRMLANHIIILIL